MNSGIKKDWGAYDRFLVDRLKACHVPGAQICVMDESGVVYEKNYGFRDEASTLPVDGNTVFGIASLSKSITAFALALLEHEDKVSFDDPVYRYIPDLRIPGTPREALLIRHLANHTSGIPPIPTFAWSDVWSTPDDPWQHKHNERIRRESACKVDTLNDIIGYLRGVKALGQPGEYMSYSNEGYAILSRIVDIVSGETLESYVQREIFDKLGMTHSTFNLAKVKSSDNYTSLFYKWNGTMRCSDNWNTVNVYRGCGSIKSTARDLTRFYLALSQNGFIDGQQVFPKACIERIIGKAFPETKQSVYCFGLGKRSFGQDVLCSHSGGLKGVSSIGGFFKSGGFAVSILTNLSDVEREPLLYGACFVQQSLPVNTEYVLHRAVDETVEVPSVYIGVYQSLEAGVKAKVACDESGGLICDAMGIRFNLVFAGETTFMMIPQGTDLKQGDPVKFMVRDGKAWGVVYKSRVFPRKE